LQRSLFGGASDLLPIGAERHFLNLLVQLQNRVEQHLGARRTTWQVDIDGYYVVYTLNDRVVVEHPARGGAYPHRQNPFRLRHLVVYLTENRCHLLADSACDDHQIGLPG
jgi:hypothetical protein